MKESQFFRVYNFRDPQARGRLCILVFTVIEGLLGYITSGVFYTVFLQGYNVNITGAGILSFVPYIASLLVLFTPGMLNRFPRRKWLLGGCKLAYYFFNIIGLTWLPAVVTDDRARVIGMVSITLLSSLFNVVATTGYSAWHIRFQPEEVRAYHVSTTQLSLNVLSGIFTLGAGWLCDKLPFSFIIGLRYFAFILGVVAVVCLMFPHEVDYPVEHPPRFSDIVTIPPKNRKFLWTMCIVFFWYFAVYCCASQTTYYLIDTVGMSTTFNTVILFLYGIAFILFTVFWRKRIMHTSWFSVFAKTLVVIGILQVLYGFVGRGSFTCSIGTLTAVIPYYIPYMLAVNIPKHIVSVGHNIAFGNFPYIHMPVVNRDCYASFYVLVVNLGTLAGMLFGILFTAATESVQFSLFGIPYETGTPLLIAVSGIIQIVIAAAVLCNRSKIEPNANDNERA